MKYDIVITVAGTVPFPIDMLRYDDCRPRREHDSSAIAASWYADVGGDERKERTIELLTHRQDKQWTPTGPRWASFQWHVRSVEVLR